jgi:hypothetical protein
VKENLYAYIIGLSLESGPNLEIGWDFGSLPTFGKPPSILSGSTDNYWEGSA